MEILGISIKTFTEAAKNIVKDIDASKSNTAISQDAGSTIENAEATKAVDSLKNTDNKEVTVKEPDKTKIWAAATKKHNEIIPDEKTVKIDGNDKGVTLGGSQVIAGENVDTISTSEQHTALKDSIKKATEASKKSVNDFIKNVTKVPNLLQSLANPDGINVKLTASDKEAEANEKLAALDKNRAELNKRREEIRVSSQNPDLAKEQKEALKAEAAALSESINKIDAIPKVFKTQNGAKIKIDNASNIKSFNAAQLKDTDITDTNLEGYEGMFKPNKASSGDKPAGEVTVPKVSDAYNAFKKDFEDKSGKDFQLGDNQNLIMYREGDEVKFLIVHSTENEKQQRTTKISKPIVAKRDNPEEGGKTTIDSTGVYQSTDSQRSATIMMSTFDDNNTKLANTNNAPEAKAVKFDDIGFGKNSPNTISTSTTIPYGYTEEPVENLAWLDTKVIKYAAPLPVPGTNTSNIQNDIFNLELTEDQKLVLSKMSPSFSNIQNKTSGLTPTEIGLIRDDLSRAGSHWKPLSKAIHANTPLNSLLLNSPINSDDASLKNIEYEENIGNRRYQALMTSLLRDQQTNVRSFMTNNSDIVIPGSESLPTGVQ